MTSRTITLKEICEAWRYEPQKAKSDHLATSAVFDLIHHSLDDKEKGLYFQHLAECSACLQNIESMLKIRVLALMVEGPPAVAGDSPSGEQASFDGNGAHQVRLLRERRRGAAMLTLQDQPQHHSD